MPKTAQQTRRESRRLFRWCMVDGSLDESRVREVVRRVLGPRRRGYIKLLTELQRLVKSESFRHMANVESAVPLTPDLKVRACESLRTAYGEGVITTFAQSPDLIGGMRIQIGCDVYDGSVRCRLALLERSLGIEPICKPLRAA